MRKYAGHWIAYPPEMGERDFRVYLAIRALLGDRPFAAITWKEIATAACGGDEATLHRLGLNLLTRSQVRASVERLTRWGLLSRITVGRNRTFVGWMSRRSLQECVRTLLREEGKAKALPPSNWSL